ELVPAAVLLAARVFEHGASYILITQPADAQLSRNQAPHGLVGDFDTAFSDQVSDVTIAEREPELEPDRMLGDRRRKAVTAV
ncbi:MAG: hypothetical protein V3R98_01180, partial [Alphaproteobacteria bacterium]